MDSSGGEGWESRRRERLRCVLVALAWAASSSSSATAQLLGPEFQVNSYTTNHQRNCAVAADDAGNFVVVWSSFQDGSYSAVVGQRFDAVGNKVGGEFQVNSYTTGYQAYPALAADSSGNFVVVWESYGQDGSLFGVFARRYDTAGLPLGDEFQVNTYTTNGQRVPSVAVDGSGGFVVVWSSREQDGSGYGVFGQRFNPAGSPVGGEFQVNSYTTSAQSTGVVAADFAGDFTVVWMSSDQDGSTRGVFGQRFDSAGAPAGSEFQVNTYTTDQQDWPAVAANAAGEVVVVWESSGQDGSYSGIFGQRFDAAGTPAGSEFQVNLHSGLEQGRPAVAEDAQGSFIVVWESYGQDGAGFGLFARNFDSAGGGWPRELQANSVWTADQRDPAAAIGGSGEFVVVWESSDGQDGSMDGVFGQRLQNWLFLDGFETGQVCGWSVAVGSGDVCF